ncbi:MAG: hypothetical protein Q9216_000801 [Gyalolechia sp. 2 TL-2023]
MATATKDSSFFILPEVPYPHQDFVSYINRKHGGEVPKLVSHYNGFEAKLREGFAQYRDHPSLQDPNVNAVPIFNQSGDVPRITQRDIDEKTHHQTYIMPLSAKDRKAQGSPATVESIADFRRNFNLFSESSLADLDWSNIVAAGSSVVTSLLPVPDKHNTSKKAQREYYHQQLAPSSDVDLFIWGLGEDDALKKIEEIEQNIRNAILEEVTTVRTKNAITIASHYPIRHVQVVLRLYKSVSEILSGFDVDCSCFAFDGTQVYGTPRGIAALMTQTNTIDLTRRSPSYESRLSKYAHRGFEVYWPDLERSKVDPTIFERSFTRTVGLARLLVLEQLPKPGDREDYLFQRREERGRPRADPYRSRHSLRGNVKEQDPNDVPEWAYDDQISNYHSFTVPYGPKYTAKRIEKLLYTKDLLLNAEWNKSKERTVNLHRHPCFMGPLRSVVRDCCGFCPLPKTGEERKVAEEESKIYVYGDLEFMKDDPGRQAIGSFRPLTDADWTDMAYVGRTQELCQRICDGDIAFVARWCKKNADSVNQRDHTGRTPLHLAAQSSTPEILKCLIDNGARIVSRLVDGLTALHIASARGSTEMVTILLERSEENEAEEADREERRKAEKREATQSLGKCSEGKNKIEEDSDEVMEDVNSEEDTIMTSSFVKVGDKDPSEKEALDGNDDAEPDIYDVNVLAWDTPVSPLHLAIIGGHAEVVKTLIGTFGADSLLPIKIINQYTRSPQHATMNLVLAARLPDPRVMYSLLQNGASVAQADMGRISSFHYLVAAKKVDMLRACMDEDAVASRSALNQLVVGNRYWRPRAESPLETSIRTGNPELVEYLLKLGAHPSIDIDSFASAYSATEDGPSYQKKKNDDIWKIWSEDVTQPIFLAVENDMPEIAIKLLDHNDKPDINSIDKRAHLRPIFGQNDELNGRSLLDAVISKVEDLGKAIDKKLVFPEPPTLPEDASYHEGSKPYSYAQWYISKSFTLAQTIITRWEECRARKINDEEQRAGKEQKLMALEDLRARFIHLKQQLKDRGAKTLEELSPGRPRPKDDDNNKPDPGKDVPVEMDFQVRFEVSASDKILAGYLKLFQAAWEGNNDTIKELTLANWGPDGDRKPLQVTAKDKKGFTPFAIALFRRHFESAKLLLGIADAQFKEPNKQHTKRRYELAEEPEYEDDSDDDGVKLSSQVVDETYTYDSIALLQESVGSNVSGRLRITTNVSKTVSNEPSAIEMLLTICEVWWFLDKPEKEARDTVGAPQIDVGNKLKHGMSTSHVYQGILTSRYNTRLTFGRFALMKRKEKETTVAQDFQFALERGLVEEIAEMIKIGGAELPLDALVKKTGLENTEAPKYYKGLSIGGQKMTGWAREQGGNSDRRVIGESTPPLLQAANAGRSVAAVEWFLSDGPLRRYKNYKKGNKEDPRLRKLTEAGGGFEAVVGQWLKKRNNLALHAALLSQADSTAIIDYLIAAMPESIDVPSARDQLTPLALAFLKGKVGAASALIKAGADQTTRDVSGKNLVHLALINASKSADTKDFRTLMDLIDKRLIRSLFVERCKDGPGGLTPLGLWSFRPDRDRYTFIHTARASLSPGILATMWEFGGEEAFTMMDGSGQFPLHQAVKSSQTVLVRLLLERDPALLFRENAMGQTPLELAHSLYVAECANVSLDIRRLGYKPLGDREPEDFVEKQNDIDSADVMNERWDGDIPRTWKICQKSAEKEPRARKLVSVNEAREVAKRLAEKKKREGEEAEMKEKPGGGEGKEKVKADEVDKWLSYRALDLS